MRGVGFRLIRVTNAGRIILGLNKGYEKNAEVYMKLEKEELKLEWMTRDKSVSFKRKSFEIGEYVLVKCDGFKRGIVKDTYQSGKDDERIYEVYLYDHGLIAQLRDKYVAGLKEEWKTCPLPRTVIVQLTGVLPAKRVLNLAKLALGETSEVYSQTSEWPRTTNLLVEEWLRTRSLTVTIMKTNDDGSVHGDIVRKSDDGLEESLIDMLLKEKLAVENESHRTSQLNLNHTPVKLSSDGQKHAHRSQKSSTGLQNQRQQPQPSTSKASYLNPKKMVEAKCVDSSQDDDVEPISFLPAGSSYFDDVEPNDITRCDGDNNLQLGIPGVLLVRGKCARSSYSRMEDLQLPANIIKALESIGTPEISAFQKAVAPNFIRGFDLIVISADGGKQPGKHTRVLSYFLPVLRLMHGAYDTMENFDGCCPETIIVCNSYVSGTSLELFIRTLLKFSQHLPLRVKFLYKDDPKQAWRLPSGVSILILTVNHLNEILRTPRGTKLLEKLRFIVFEELELYLSKHFMDLKNFIEMATVNIRVGGNTLPFQLVFSGSKWSDDVERLYKALVRSRNPVVFIHAINQAIRYAKVEWIVHHIRQEEDRVNKLIDLLKTGSASHQRIVIACSTVPVAKAVHEALLDRKIEARLVTTNLLQSGFKGDYDLLVIPDDRVGSSFDVTNATWLIAFDSPVHPKYGSSKKSTAALRFGYFWKNIRSIDKNESDPNINLVCHFLLTGEEHNFYAMYKFAETLENATFPPKLKALAIAMDAENSDKQLCEGIKLYGFCNYADPAHCTARHGFTKQDFMKITHGPLTGEVEFRITKCESPSLYQAQLLRHYLYENGKRNVKTSYINELGRRSKELSKNQSEAKTLQKSKIVEGKLFAVLEPETSRLTRCKITKVLAKDTFDNPKTVHVYCIDSGISLNPSVDDLFELSPEQEEWTPLVVELVLTNLKPPNSEMEYRSLHEKNAKKLTYDKIYNAKIWLSIGNTIWVNPMVEYHIDSYTRQTVKGSSIRISLMRLGAADHNPVHLKNLSNLVKKHGDLYKGSEYEIEPRYSAQDELADIVAKEEFYQFGDVYRWAFVQISSESKVDPAEIATTFADDPWTFYGVHRKFESIVESLETELSLCIEKYISENYPTYDDQFVELYEPDMIVAVKEPEDGRWNRAMVIAKHDLKEEPNPRFDVFYVDHGDRSYDLTTKVMFPIPVNFVNRIPFQIMAFKLDHVIPLNRGRKWERAIKEEFQDFILPNRDSVYIQLLALCKADNSDLPISCQYYDVMAFLDDKELGEHLVQKSEAEFKAGAENRMAEVREKLLQFYNDIVSKHVEENNDDGEDEDSSSSRGIAIDCPTIDEDTLDFNLEGEMLSDFMQAFGMVVDKDFAKKLSCQPDLDQEPGPPVREEPTLEQPQQPKASSGLTVMQATTNSNSSSKLTPTVKWRQTDTSLILTVMVPDIQEFDLKIGADKRTISFQTVNPANYGFTMKAFGKVTNYNAFPTGQCLKLEFTKRMTGAKWIRVIRDKDAKLNWLKVDTEYVTEEDEDDDDPGNESDDYEKWSYERDENGEDTEMYLTLDAELECGEDSHVFHNSSDSDSD